MGGLRNGWHVIGKNNEKIVISSRIHKHKTLFSQFQGTFRNDLDLARVRGRTIYSLGKYLVVQCSEREDGFKLRSLTDA